MCTIMSRLVIIYDDKTSDESENSSVCKCCVYESTSPFLPGRMCGLKDECGLGYEENPDWIEKLKRSDRSPEDCSVRHTYWMCRKEAQLMSKYSRPYKCYKLGRNVRTSNLLDIMGLIKRTSHIPTCATIPLPDYTISICCMPCQLNVLPKYRFW